MPPGRVTLIVNPASGRAAAFHKQLPAIERLLCDAGFTPQLIATSPNSGSTLLLARQAAAQSALVLACGGDGTVHDVIQGLAHTGTPLGVLPLGTANALARNLGLPLDPLEALERLLTYTPVSIPLGVVATSTAERYFAVMAGCGPDGALVHALSGATATRFKARFGRSAYYLQAAHLFATRRWPAFEVSYREPHSAAWTRMEAIALLAARVPNLGGAFRGLTPLASLTAPTLHLQILRPPAHRSLAAWFTLSRAGLPNPLLQTVDAAEARCEAPPTAQVYAQADAEPVGLIPLQLRILPNALALLLPPLRDPSA
jgi:diacylglycerol kinase family enzyme